MVHHGNTDTVAAITGSATTFVLWIADYSPVAVLLSALITVGFTAHKWIVFAKDRRKLKQSKIHKP